MNHSKLTKVIFYYLSGIKATYFDVNKAFNIVYMILSESCWGRKLPETDETTWRGIRRSLQKCTEDQ